MVCGLLGFVLPCCGAVLGLLGIALGVTALSRDLPHRERAIVGIVAGAVSPFLSMAFGWFLVGS